ncbi:MAG: DUF3737 family protein [Clostridia bacterium]|nr:DUF3737 family protein [Clostridia bacterium]
MKIIENKNFPSERALYNSSDVLLRNCTFEGEEDGESALKESRNVRLENCRMDLRYPLWHDSTAELFECGMTENCRAPLWYSENVRIRSCRLHGVKALRECRGAEFYDTEIVSPEFGWRNRGIVMENCSVTGEYAFFSSSDIRLKGIKFSGKYSFQYVENLVIEDSVLDTKDAFWHAKNVTVRNSVVNGEYLGWYSEGLTLENCRIKGTQPLCYCRGLRLVDCETEAADLSFEYSDVDADLKGNVVSVKNPRSGRIVADSIGEIILTDDSVYPCECEIKVR